MSSRLAAVECIANVAASFKLRGNLVRAGALPALCSLLSSRVPELKRWAMIGCQRLAATTHTTVVKDDPAGYGFALELVQEGRVGNAHGLSLVIGLLRARLEELRQLPLLRSEATKLWRSMRASFSWTRMSGQCMWRPCL